MYHIADWTCERVGSAIGGGGEPVALLVRTMGVECLAGDYSAGICAYHLANFHRMSRWMRVVSDARDTCTDHRSC